MRDEGHLDYFAVVTPFAREGAIGQMNCVYSHWMTRHPEGFSATPTSWRCGSWCRCWRWR